VLFYEVLKKLSAPTAAPERGNNGQQENRIRPL
jgi:hypothetical protein